MMSSHEDFSRTHDVRMGSDQSFGIVFCAVFALIGLYPLVGGSGVRHWALGISVAFLLVAFARPELLGPLNRVWLKFGLLLGRIVSPLAMGLVFFLVMTPIGLVMRLFGKDLLRLRLEPESKSYWIERRPPGPAPETMTHQF